MSDVQQVEQNITVLAFLKQFPHVWSREKFAFASNTEKQRWIEQGAVIINGQKVTSFKADVDFPVDSLVLFPSGKSKITLW